MTLLQQFQRCSDNTGVTKWNYNSWNTPVAFEGTRKSTETIEQHHRKQTKPTFKAVELQSFKTALTPGWYWNNRWFGKHFPEVQLSDKVLFSPLHNVTVLSTWKQQSLQWHFPRRALNNTQDYFSALRTHHKPPFCPCRGLHCLSCRPSAIRSSQSIPIPSWPTA